MSKVVGSNSMKRHGNLFEKIISTDNLHKAVKKASRGKRWQRKIQQVLAHEDELVNRLHEILKSGTYRTSQYKTKQIFEPKERTIYILPFFPDRIVHHAVMNVLEPIWDNLMLSDSYACRIGKGQHAGSTRCMQFVRRFRYCLKCDVSKFYPSIDHAVLKAIIRKKIKDSKLLALLDEIISSAKNGKNVPIGNYLSQWFGNLYLNELDTFVKQTLGVKPYLRYCDDFCLFSDDKAQLHGWADRIKTFLSDNLLLRLSKCNVFPTTHGVDFLGYRHFSQGYVLVRKATAVRIKKRMATLMNEVRSKRISKDQAVSKIASAQGWMMHANTYNLSVKLKIDNLKDFLNAQIQ